MKTLLLASLLAGSAVVFLAASHFDASAQKLTQRPDLTCSDWRTACKKRRGSDEFCTGKFNLCVETGCWTETPRYGSDKWCSLQKK